MANYPLAGLRELRQAAVGSRASTRHWSKKTATTKCWNFGSTSVNTNPRKSSSRRSTTSYWWVRTDFSIELNIVSFVIKKYNWFGSYAMKLRRLSSVPRIRAARKGLIPEPVTGFNIVWGFSSIINHGGLAINRIILLSVWRAYGVWYEVVRAGNEFYSERR